MAQAIADPEELRNFAGSLIRYLEGISSETATLKNEFARLGNTWQDQKHSSFEDRFNELIRAIEAFRESAEEEIPYINRLAEDLETYLGR